MYCEAKGAGGLYRGGKGTSRTEDVDRRTKEVENATPLGGGTLRTRDGVALDADVEVERLEWPRDGQICRLSASIRACCQIGCCAKSLFAVEKVV